MFLKVEEGSRREDQSDRGRTQPTISDFEDVGRGPQVKECRYIIEAERGNSVDFPLELPEKNADLLTP